MSRMRNVTHSPGNGAQWVFRCWRDVRNSTDFSGLASSLPNHSHSPVQIRHWFLRLLRVRVLVLIRKLACQRDCLNDLRERGEDTALVFHSDPVQGKPQVS